jgi:hypothetical protein
MAYASPQEARHARPATTLAEQLLGPGATWADWTPCWAVLSVVRWFLSIFRVSERHAEEREDLARTEQWLRAARPPEMSPVAVARVSVLVLGAIQDAMLPFTYSTEWMRFEAWMAEEGL